MSVSNLQPLTLAQQAEALCMSIDRLSMSVDKAAIATHARQLALMLRSQASEPASRYRLTLTIDLGQDVSAVINVDGSRQDVERLKQRVGYWVRMEHQVAHLDARSGPAS